MGPSDEENKDGPATLAGKDALGKLKEKITVLKQKLSMMGARQGFLERNEGEMSQQITRLEKESRALEKENQELKMNSLEGKTRSPRRDIKPKETSGQAVAPKRTANHPGPESPNKKRNTGKGGKEESWAVSSLCNIKDS